jgi:hypothetical protein
MNRPCHRNDYLRQSGGRASWRERIRDVFAIGANNCRYQLEPVLIF